MKKFSWIQKGLLMRRGVRFVALIVCILISLLDIGHASADMGPKPTMQFSFVYDMGSKPTIVKTDLLVCPDSDCINAQPLKEFGAQSITCTEYHCSFMFYRYPEYARLKVSFSDDITRQSDIFHTKTFASHFTVTVQENGLIVRQKILLSWLSSNAIFLLMILVFSPIAQGSILAMAIMLLAGNFWLGIRVGSSRAAFTQARGIYLLVWAISAVLLFLGSIPTLTLPVTVLIEIFAAAVFARLAQRPWLPLLTAVITMNLITQPFLWFIAPNATNSAFGVGILLLELFVCFIEAGLLKLSLRSSIENDDALLLSIGLNAASYLIGLFLKIT